MADKNTTSEQPPEWAVALTQKVTEGFTRLEANIQIVSNDLTVVKDRVTVIERRQDAFEASKRTHSGQIRSVSENDLKQDAAIAAVVTKVDAMATTQETHGKMLSTVVLSGDQRASVLAEVREMTAGVHEVTSNFLARNPKVGLLLLGILFAVLQKVLTYVGGHP